MINAVTNETPFRGGTRPMDGGKGAYGRRTRPSLGKAQEGGMLKCKFCCRSHEFHKELCPAWDKKCRLINVVIKIIFLYQCYVEPIKET